MPIATYNLNKVRQLIDLNGDTTNFEISFKAVSKNREPFDMLIVDQTTLDNTPTLEFKKAVNGEIAGNIVQDKNVYQNYFMVLKADNPCQCDVEIIKKELPKSLPIQSLEKDPSVSVSLPSSSSSISISSVAWFIIILAVGAGVIWYLFFRKKSESESIPLGPSRNSPVRGPLRSPVGSPLRSPIHSPIVKPDFVPKANSLLERLKNVNIPI